MKIHFFTHADNYPGREGVAPATAGIVHTMKDWPADWDDKLREMMPHMTNIKIARSLGATVGLVGFRIQKIGARRTPEEQERLYGNLRGRLVMGMNKANQQAPGTCRFIQKRKRVRPKKNGGVRQPQKPEWWIFLGKGERMPLRRYLWETWIGPVPKGYNICYADGNTRRCILSNLICLKNSEMTTYFAQSISRAMQLRAFWNSPRAKESFQKSAETRRVFFRSEEGKATIARRSEKIKAMNAAGLINNPFIHLHDNVVAHYLAQDEPTRQYILEHRPDLIELKRTELLLKRTIKKHENEPETEH